MQALLRAYFGYLFLIFIVRLVGRRPGKQLTPFEYVLIFLIGGLALTAIVGDERSFSNALCEIFGMAAAHYTVTWLRARSARVARLIDGTPLFLLRHGCWRVQTMKQMRIENDDVMYAARDKGCASLDQVGSAVLERNGDISILPPPRA